MPATQYAGKELSFLGQRISVGSFLGASGGTSTIISFSEEQPMPFCMLDFALQQYPNFMETYYDPELDETVSVPINEKYWYLRKGMATTGDIVWAFGFTRVNGYIRFAWAVSRSEWTSTGPGGSTVHPSIIIQEGDTPNTYPPRAPWIKYYKESGGVGTPMRGFEFYSQTVSTQYAGVPENWASLTEGERNFHRMANSIYFWAPAVEEGDPEYHKFKVFDMYQNIGRTICYTPDEINSWGGYTHDSSHAPFFPYDVLEHSGWIATTPVCMPMTSVSPTAWNNIQPYAGPTVYEMVIQPQTEEEGIAAMGSNVEYPNQLWPYYNWATAYAFDYNRLAEGRFSDNYEYCPLDCGTIIEPDESVSGFKFLDDDDNETPEPDPEEETDTDGFPGENDEGYPVPNIEITDTGMWQLYTPTPGQLRSFNGWLWSNDYKTAINEWGMQPSEQIVMFGMVPFNVASSGTNEVYMAGKPTGLNMNVAASMWVHKNLGKVNIDGPTQSFLDHTSTTYNLFLPFVGFVPLRTADVVWSQLSIHMYANIITGDLTYNVYVYPSSTGLKRTLTGKHLLCYTYTGNCLMNLPINNANYGAYYSQQRRDVFGILGDLVKGIGGGAAAGAMAGGVPGAIIGGITGAVGSTGSIIDHATHLESNAPEVQRSGSLGGALSLLGYNKPYLLINQPKTYKKGYYDFYSYPTMRGDKSIGTYKGWVYCSRVKEITNGTDSEKKEIISLLTSGVYIK